MSRSTIVPVEGPREILQIDPKWQLAGKVWNVRSAQKKKWEYIIADQSEIIQREDSQSTSKIESFEIVRATQRIDQNSRYHKTGQDKEQ